MADTDTTEKSQGLEIVDDEVMLEEDKDKEANSESRQIDDIKGDLNQSGEKITKKTILKSKAALVEFLEFISKNEIICHICVLSFNDTKVI